MTRNNTLFIRNEFGPFAQSPGRQDFDFTLLFEETILSILPSALLLVAAPVRIVQLWYATRKVAASQLRNVKIVMLAVFVALHVVNLVVWCLHPQLQTQASLAAVSLSVATAAALCGLSYMEHSRGVQPSSIINTYLLLTVFTDAAKVRTLWLRSDAASVAGVGSALLAVKLAILVAEAKEKRKYLLSPYSELPPEATSGIYSRSLFWWLNPVFLLGFKSVLREIDIFPTDNDLASETLRKRFAPYWSKRRSPARKHELLIAITRCLFKPFLAGVIPRLCYVFFRFMQPLLIKRVTRLISQPDTSAARNQGWGLTAAYGLVYLGLAISSAKYNHNGFRLATMVRGVLVTTIYGKTMDLSITALDENVAVTLMSTDVQRICDEIAFIHELWGCPIEIGVAIWLLYTELGLAVLGSLMLSMLAISGALFLSTRTGPAQKEWIARIQTRIDVTAKALQSMKGIKILGLTTTLGDIIHRLRMTEIAESLRARRLLALSIIGGNTTDIWASGVSFAIFVIIARFNGQTLNVSSAYAALSIMDLLGNPIGTLSFKIPPFMAAVGCFDRIQQYLLLAARNDHRLLMSSSQGAKYKQVQRPSNDGNADVAGIELQEIVTSTPSAAKLASKEPIVQVVNLTLFWADSPNPVIKDVSFDMTSGITMLVGPVGCGKSSLLKGLLGEIPSSKGYIYTDSLQIAFVGQSPWIQHGTVRENIVGVSTFEHHFYSKVVHACALDQDFESLAQGDHTLVGSTGASLSGGQKLRIALARAVYSRRHILMLDDVFSGLDATSEDRIFSRLLGKSGLLRDMDTVVLLSTHAAHRLSYADNIIALDSHGSICEQGSFVQLMSTEGYVSTLAARHTVELDEKAKEEAPLTGNANLSDSTRAAAADDLKRAVGDVTVYKYYFAAIGYRKVAVLFLATVVWAVFYLSPNLLLKFWTSAVESKGNSVNAMYLCVYLSMEMICWLALAVMCIQVFTRMIPVSARALHQRLLDTMSNAPLSFFTSTDVGQVVNRFSQDLAVIDAELPGALFQCMASAFIGFFQAILICLSAAYFAVLMPLVLGLMYIIQKFYLRTSRQIRLMDLEAKAPLYSNFIESVNGLATIRAFGWTRDFEQRNLDLLDTSQRPFYLLFCIQRWLNLVLDLTVGGLAVLLMILIVILRSKLDAGLVGVALLNIMGFNISLTQVIKNWTTLETSLGAISRVKTFVEETSCEHLPKENIVVAENWPLQGSIDLYNMSASYTLNGPRVLKDITLSIPAGQKVGIVGRSGSGKSSFVTTLFHLLELQNGNISIDHVDLASIPRETLRQRLTIIPQDPLFIASNIRTNLDPFSSSSDDALATALRTVGLWDIISKAGGLEIPMDPENLLSHGQRQLFCLARAIVNKSRSRILVLDEATASVDIRTDETMQRIIRDEFRDCTIIAIAHRLGTIIDFDRVIVLDAGRLVEDGVPAELLKDSETWFRKLWDS